MELTTSDDGLVMREMHNGTEDKIHYLSRAQYIFSNGMCKQYSHLNYIDLLAGPGKHQSYDKSTTIFGSPILALQDDRKFTNYFFVEMDKINFDALETRCTEYKAKRHINTYNEDCNTAVDKIKLELSHQYLRSLTLAFVDPEGLEVHWDTIKKLASIPRTDLLINYCESGIMRNLENGVNSPNIRAKMDKYFGDNGWEAIYNRNPIRKKMFQIRRDLLTYYLNNLKNIGFVYTSTPKDSVRVTNNNTPLYRLIYASRSPTALHFWEESISKDSSGQMRLKLPDV